MKQTPCTIWLFLLCTFLLTGNTNAIIPKKGKDRPPAPTEELPPEAHWQTSAVDPVPYDAETRPMAGPYSGAETGKKSQSSTELIVAAQAGNSRLIGQLLQMPTIATSMNHRDGDGWSALSHAVGEGHLAVVKLLLGRGADPNVKDRHDLWTPLFHAASNGMLDIVKLLLENKASARARDVQDWTVLMHAVSMGQKHVAKELVQYDCNINAADPAGWTALMEAAGNGKPGIVEILIKNGANVDHTDRSGDNARKLASVQGHSDVVQAIDRAQQALLTDEEVKIGLKKKRKGASKRADIWDKIDLGEGFRFADDAHDEL